MNTPFKDRLGVYLPLHGCPNHPLNSVTRQFAWSAGKSVTQILSEKTEGVDFLYGYGRTAVSAWDNRDRKDGYGVFSRDVNGSTLRTEQTRSWARANSYDVFGASLDIHDTLDVPAFGYRGELTSDDSVFLRARNYDTRIGWFTSRDPVTSRIGQVQPRSPYVYGGNDPVNQTDPLGKYSLSSIFSSLTSALNALHSGNPFGDCPDSGNSLRRHSKCFQGEGPLRTRGYYMDVCLRDYPGSEPCLSSLWFAHQPERAAQAFTITELNRKRRGWISRAIGTTNIQQTVDWEVGFSDNLNPDEETGFQGFRLDIVTDEKNIYEVKRYAGPATTTEVSGQLNRYIRDGKTWFGIEFVPGSELQEWEDTFVVYDGSTGDFLTGGTTVFVWGEFNPPGHVYFSEKRDKVPPEVRAEIRRDEQNEALRNFLGIPVPIPVPVPVP